MDLKEINLWAESIDLTDVDEKNRHHVKCYKDMILQKVQAIGQLTTKTQNYIDDIQEYVAQLSKKGVKLGLPTLEETTKTEEPLQETDVASSFDEEPVDKTKDEVMQTEGEPSGGTTGSASPLIPKEEDQHSPQGAEKSAEGQKVL